MSDYYCQPDECCSGERPMTFLGMFGSRGEKFARYECPECGVNRPESVLQRIRATTQHPPTVPGDRP